jgi:hypothetical protein
MSDAYNEIHSRLEKLLFDMLGTNDKDKINEMVDKKIQSITAQYIEFTKSQKCLQEELDTSNKVLIKFGWPPFYYTYRWGLNRIIKLATTYTDEATLEEKLNEYLIQQLEYKKFTNLDYLLEEWNSVNELVQRRHILDQIVIAHKNHLYAISIPATIIQIEGVIIDSLGKSGRVSQNKLKNEYFPEFLQRHNQSLNENPLHEFITKTFYDQFEWGDQEEHENSRNAILHGAKCDYDTQVNSVKMIYCLDCIIHIAYSIDIDNSNIKVQG